MAVTPDFEVKIAIDDGGDGDDDGDDDFYIALFSALEQTHCARMRFYTSE